MLCMGFAANACTRDVSVDVCCNERPSIVPVTFDCHVNFPALERGAWRFSPSKYLEHARYALRKRLCASAHVA